MDPARIEPTHSWSLGMEDLWGFGLGLASQKSGCWWRSRMPLSAKTPLFYPHPEYVIRLPGLSDLLLSR